MGELNPIYNAADAQFLMDLVYRDGAEYAGENVSGLASHSITVDQSTGSPTLTVSFESSDGVTLAGRWTLELVSVVSA